MNNLWLKIRIWTKVVLFSVLGIYAMMLIWNNMGQEPAKVWYWIGGQVEAPLLALLFFTFMFGVIATLLFRTTLRTLRQIRELRLRNAQKQAETRAARAAKLQTRPAGGSSASSSAESRVIDQ